MSNKSIGSHEQHIINNRIGINGIAEKRCTKCLKWKDANLDNFYLVNKSKPERGLTPTCRECTRAKQKKVIENNPEYNRENALRHYYLKRDKEIVRLKQWRQDNKEHKYIYQKSYEDLHKEQRKIYNTNRNHKIHEITGTEWESCKRYFKYRCAYCGMPLELHYEEVGTDFHKEHNDPNGSNLLDNCVPSCASCNYKKWSHEFEFWYNRDNLIFNQEFLNAINKWKESDYKLYIEPKLPYRIMRKRNEGMKTFHYELWTIDYNRNNIKCIDTKIHKKDLDLLLV